MLDFGCGYRYFKKKLLNNKKIKVINFDIVKELTEIDNWKKKNLIILLLHKFLYILKKKLNKLLLDLKKKQNIRVIITISKQGFLNKLGAFILNEPEAHTNLNLTPSEEIQAFTKHMKILKRKSVFFLADVYLLEFR